MLELPEDRHRFGAGNPPPRGLFGFMCAVCTDDHSTPNIIVAYRDYRLYLKEHRETQQRCI